MAKNETRTVANLLREYAHRTSLRGGNPYRTKAYLRAADAHYAGGLSLQEITEQHREADRLNRRYGEKFRILKGIEADILADGSLDYPDDVLEQFAVDLDSVRGFSLALGFKSHL